MNRSVIPYQKHAAVLLFCLSLIMACGPSDMEEEEAFDASRINQHMDEEVSFDERYRPQFHYTPKINWMNDPNGLVYHDGTFHLFHQYNPFGKQWGYMSWNHATSPDLVHWQHQPVAIPYGEEEEEAIYSGSAVVDHNNTSGFGDWTTAPIVAIYSSAYGGERPHQSQSLAYSTDGGETFQKYEGNPVLEFEDPDFRDPNVKWHDDIQKWIMVVALPLQYKVQFYSSDNLIDWEYLSDFGPAGAVSGIWECPDLFPLAVNGDPDNMKWVLHVDMNPGAIAGGSGSQFFVGDWDGQTFTADDSISEGEILWADYGTDFYAAISWNNVPEEDGRRLWLGWMNNWEYANEIPTDPWRSAMSIPRSVQLETIEDNIAVIQRPVEELQQLRGEAVQLNGRNLTEGNHLLTDDGISGKAYEVIVELEPVVSESVGLNVRESENQETVIGYDAVTGTVFVDRTQSGEDSFGEDFARRMDAPARLIDGKIKLHIFVDWSSVEVFINGGEQVITSRIFPDPGSTGVSLFADGGDASLAGLTFWPLESIWD
ncbi:glycoside hydrolase family 32 protein [Rhodohalobacter sp. 8-1]|uniref:glycoside hydrolase family 32 protein n=1 Tax=Rhodohalobacter sp. 8-1 TaxID=3131972 RepID=UPI0030EB4E4E